MKNTILFVVQKLSDGGAERVVSVLSSSLAKMGENIHVLIYFPTSNEYELNRQVKKHYLTNNKEEYNALSMPGKILKIRQFINKLDTCYVVPFLFFIGMHVQMACLGLKVKVIQTVRNDPRSVPESAVLRILRNVTYLFMWRGFVQNQRQLTYFPKIIQRKLSVLPNPVSEQFFYIKHQIESKWIIVSAGRLQVQKNFPMLARAAAELKKTRDDFVIYIYGEGELRKDIQSVIDDLKVNDCCVLAGRSNQMTDVYQSADIFVMTSNFEGMPNALMEAMASAVPCISTDCPTGPSELIDNGINGFLIDMNDSHSLACKLEWCMNNRDEISGIGENARQKIKESFCPDSISKRFLKEVLLYKK